MDIHDARFTEQVPEVEALPLQGLPFLDETVLYIARRRRGWARTWSFVLSRMTTGAFGWRAWRSAHGWKVRTASVVCWYA